MKETHKSNIKGAIFIISMIIIISLLVISFPVGLYYLDKHNYEQTLNTLPNLQKVKDDLRTVFVSNNINIIDTDTDINIDTIIYTVMIDNKDKYLVLYKIERKDRYYSWIYKSHRLVIEGGDM